MRVEKINASIIEAQRFIRAARAARDLFSSDEGSMPPSPQNAAVRRASMDLTRALADLRRPG